MTAERDARGPVTVAMVLSIVAAMVAVRSVTDASLVRMVLVMAIALILTVPLGAVLARWVLPSGSSAHQRVGLTIGLGYAVAPLMLLFTARFGMLGLLAPMWVAVVWFLVRRMRGRRARSTADGAVEGSPEEAASVVATIAALSVALVTPFMHPIREVTSVLSVNYAYIDTYFHTNLVQALMRHTPLAEWPNVAGMPPIFYQDFHHLWLASLARLARVSANEMYVLYAPVMLVVFTVVLAYAVGRAMTCSRVGGYLAAALQYIVLVPNLYDRNWALRGEWSVVLPNFYQIHFYNLRYAQHAASGWIVLLALVLCWSLALRPSASEVKWRAMAAAGLLLAVLFRVRPQYFLVMVPPTAVLTLWVGRRQPAVLAATALAGAAALALVLYPYDTLGTNSSGLVLKYGVFAARVSRAGYFLPNAVTRVLAYLPALARPAVGLALILVLRIIGVNLVVLLALGARRLRQWRGGWLDRIESYLWMAIASAYLMALFVEQSAVDGNIGWNIVQGAVAPALLLATAAIVELTGRVRLEAFWTRRRAALLATSTVFTLFAYRGAEATMLERTDRAYPLTSVEYDIYRWMHANLPADGIVASDPRHRVNANGEMFQNTNLLAGMTERSVYAQYLSPLTRPEVDRRIAALAEIFDATSPAEACREIAATTATWWLEFPDRPFAAGALPCLTLVQDGPPRLYRTR